MPAPETREELEQTAFFKAGADAKRRNQPLQSAIACLRLGCWQYDAFIAGYDAAPKVSQANIGGGIPMGVLGPITTTPCV